MVRWDQLETANEGDVFLIDKEPFDVVDISQSVYCGKTIKLIGYFAADILMAAPEVFALWKESCLSLQFPKCVELGTAAHKCNHAYIWNGGRRRHCASCDHEQEFINMDWVG